MTGEHGQDRVERVLRAVFAEQASHRTPPVALVDRVRRHNRLRRRALVSAAASAAVLVAAGVPAGLSLVRADRPPADPVLRPPSLTTPRPTPPPPGPRPAGDPCVPARSGLPAPVPADRLPRQTGVRGSLAGDESLVDAVLVAGWQGLRSWPTESRPAWDARTLRVQFVERAGAGILALVVASDPAGRRATEWVVGRGRWFVPDGGEVDRTRDDQSARELGELFWGEDPLYVSSHQVCGQTYGIVLAPPDATVRVAPAPRIGADARPVYPARRPVSLVGGLAVFPAAAPATTKITLSHGRDTLASRVLNLTPGGSYVTELTSGAEIGRAVRAGGGTPDRSLVTFLAQGAAMELAQTVAEVPTGLRVPWGGPVPGGRQAAMVALTLPSGAVYVQAAIGKGATYDGFYEGLLPAGRLGDAVLSWRYRDLLIVVAPAAARVEAVLPGGTVLPVRLVDGGVGVTVPGEVTAVRAYRADGSRLGESTPGTGLVLLPREG